MIKRLRKKRISQRTAWALLDAQIVGEATTPEVLEFLADRLVEVYGEHENIDFIVSARRRAKFGRDAMNQALKELGLDR